MSRIIKKGEQMAKKYYAVKIGKTPGVYNTWNECKIQVDGFPGAAYKSFSTLEAAREYISIENNFEKSVPDNLNEAIAYVDGSYSKELLKYSYGCVIQYNNKRIELSGSDNNPKYIEMNNVAGEILGSINAIKWAIENGVESINIFHDYEGISKWANGDWKANKLGTKEYQEYIKDSRGKLQINFTKVAAHTGVELNEVADQLAKKALLSETKVEVRKTKLSVVEKIFDNIMSMHPNDKDKKNFSLHEYVINDRRLTEYVKQLWSVSGKKKSEIKSIEYTLNLDEKILNVIIIDKDEIQHEKSIKLEGVL